MSSEMWKYKFFTVRVGRSFEQPGDGNIDYAIVGNDLSILGYIEWYPPWGLYILDPEPRTAWSAGCLTDVQDAIYKAEKARKEKRDE